MGAVAGPRADGYDVVDVDAYSGAVDANYGRRLPLADQRIAGVELGRACQVADTLIRQVQRPTPDHRHTFKYKVQEIAGPHRASAAQLIVKDTTSPPSVRADATADAKP